MGGDRYTEGAAGTMAAAWGRTSTTVHGGGGIAGGDMATKPRGAVATGRNAGDGVVVNPPRGETEENMLGDGDGDDEGGLADESLLEQEVIRKKVMLRHGDAYTPPPGHAAAAGLG